MTTSNDSQYLEFSKQSDESHMVISPILVHILELTRSLNILALALTENNKILAQEVLVNLQSEVQGLHQLIKKPEPTLDNGPDIIIS